MVKAGNDHHVLETRETERMRDALLRSRINIGKPVRGIICNTAVKNGRSCPELRLFHATIRDGATRRSPLMHGEDEHLSSSGSVDVGYVQYHLTQQLRLNLLIPAQPTHEKPLENQCI